MQGILIVDKPMEWTSFDVIAKLRGILGTRKLGHSGTLDPMATGVLPVFCGGASKAVDLQLDHTKTYCARLKLGLRTVEPTGKAFRIRMAASFEFAPGSDRIVCERPYYDQSAVMKALDLF